MEEIINQTLIKLEEDLQSIVSAREQVEQAVNSSTDLQKVVSEYVGSVKTLCSNIQTWEENLKEREFSLNHDVETAIYAIRQTCTEIVDAFDTKVDNVHSLFKNETKDTLDKFIEENNKLQKHVESIDALREQIKKTTCEIQLVKNSLTQISTELKESQDEQDALLDEIKQRIFELPIAIQNEAQSIISTVGRSESSIIDIINNTNIIIDGIKTKVNNLNSNIDALNTLCQNINSTIISSRTNLTNVISGSKTDILSSVADSANRINTNISNLTTLCQNIERAVSTSTNSLYDAINSSNNKIINYINNAKEEYIKSAKTNRIIMITGFVIIILLQILFKSS